MLKRLVYSFVILAVLFIVSGCMTKTENTNSDNEDTTTNDDSELVTVTFGTNMDPNNDQVKKLESLTGETLEDNRWTKLFEEKLGIDVKYQLLVSGDTYNQKINLGMTSGELPDIFLVGDKSVMRQLMEAGAVEEIGPTYESLGSDLLKSIIEKETDRVFEPVTYDGKIYGMPKKMPSTNGYNHLWIREDWLINLGLERPKTIQDLYDIAYAFTYNDPNQNGKDDTLGLLINNNFLYDMQGFFWGFDAYPQHWIEDDSGQVVNGIVQPEMKNAIKMLNNMFQEGLLDKEFGAKDNNKAMESVVSGQTGMFYGPHWSAFTLENSLENDPDAKWIVVPLPTETGEDVNIPLDIATDGAIFVKKGTKNPELLIQMFNVYVEALFSENAEFNKYFGEEGVDNIWQMSPIYTLDPVIDLQAHQEIKKAIQEGTTDSLTGVSEGFYNNMENGMWTFSMMFGPEDTPFAFVDQSYPDQIIWNAYLGAPTATMVDNGSAMGTLTDTTFTKIIQSNDDVDKVFNKMVEDWLKIGGKQVTEEVNAAKAE